MTDGVVLADLLSERLNPSAMAGAVAILQVAYGKEYSEEKLNLLYGMCREEHWSTKRFMDTLRWIIKNKPWPDWKIADFFTAPLQKLHPRSWACEQWAKGNKCKQYKLGEYVLYALASDEIPLPEYAPQARVADVQEPETVTDERRDEILAELKQRAVVTKEKYSMIQPLGKIAEEL